MLACIELFISVFTCSSLLFSSVNSAVAFADSASAAVAFVSHCAIFANNSSLLACIELFISAFACNRLFFSSISCSNSPLNFAASSSPMDCAFATACCVANVAAATAATLSLPDSASASVTRTSQTPIFSKSASCEDFILVLVSSRSTFSCVRFANTVLYFSTVSAYAIFSCDSACSAFCSHSSIFVKSAAFVVFIELFISTFTCVDASISACSAAFSSVTFAKALSSFSATSEPSDFAEASACSAASTVSSFSFKDSSFAATALTSHSFIFSKSAPCEYSIFAFCISSVFFSWLTSSKVLCNFATASVPSD